MSDTTFALVGGRFILPHRIEAGKALLINDTRIVGYMDVAALDAAVRRIDVGGRYVAPGLIDIHIHGAEEYTFNDAVPEAFDTITRLCARNGITSLLATTATASVDSLIASLELGQKWMHQQPHPGRAQILGFHLEGPYFNPDQSGAQSPADLRIPADGSASRLLAYHPLIKIMSLAPELPGAIPLIRQLASLGIVAAAGHSNAFEPDLIPALEAGLSHVIHIWSAQSSMVREGPWRKPGLLEVSLAYDNLTVEMIADARHLPPTLMKLAYKAIGAERLCIISDAISGTGLPEGSHYRMGNMEYAVQDGVGMLLDNSAFGGSTTLINRMIPILTEQVGIPLVEAVRMASLNPARVIGVAGQKGSLEVGKDADIAIFEDDFQAWHSIIGGQWNSNQL